MTTADLESFRWFVVYNGDHNLGFSFIMSRHDDGDAHLSFQGFLLDHKTHELQYRRGNWDFTLPKDWEKNDIKYVYESPPNREALDRLLMRMFWETECDPGALHFKP